MRSSAPRRRISSTLLAGTSRDMQITARRPSRAAAWASARPWLPVEAATTPCRRSSADSSATALVAPRSLKLPVCWRVSSLRWTGTPARAPSEGDATVGVAATRPPMRAAAASMSAKHIIAGHARAAALPSGGRAPDGPIRRRRAAGTARRWQGCWTPSDAPIRASMSDGKARRPDGCAGDEQRLGIVGERRHGEVNERGGADACHFAVVLEAQARKARDLEAPGEEVVAHRAAGLKRVGGEDADPPRSESPQPGCGGCRRGHHRDAGLAGSDCGRDCVVADHHRRGGAGIAERIERLAGKDERRRLGQPRLHGKQVPRCHRIGEGHAGHIDADAGSGDKLPEVGFARVIGRKDDQPDPSRDRSIVEGRAFRKEQDFGSVCHDAQSIRP